jgi:hypothetical protein
MSRFVFAAFGLVVLAACEPAITELTDDERAEIAAEVESRLDQLWDALRNPNADLILSFFCESPDLLEVHDGGFISGYATFDSLAGPVIGEWENQVITVSETRSVVLSRDVVHTMRVGTDSMTYKTGEAVPTRPWAVTYVWVRSDGEWKILLGHGSHPSPTGL